MTNLEEYSIPIFVEVEEGDLDLVDGIILGIIVNRSISKLVANIVLAKVGLAKQASLDSSEEVYTNHD